MSCVFDKERLTAFFDGELDAAERAETERHISGCSACLRDLGEIKSAASAIKTLSRPRAPRSIAEGVAREIAVAGRVRRLDVWRRRVLWGVAAAAALLVALNVSFFASPPPPAPGLAKAPSAAPGIAAAPASDSPSKKAQEEAAKESFERKDAEKSGADTVENRARRALTESRKAEADRAPAGEAPQNGLRQEGKPAAAPAPVTKAEPAKDGLKREAPAAPPGARAEAPAPAAPAPRPEAAPSPPPAPKLAAADKAVDEDARRKQADGKTDRLEKAAVQDPARAALPAVPFYTVRAGKTPEVRAQAEALARKWSAPEVGAAKAAVASAPAKPRSFGAADAAPAPLVLDVTPEQLEELRAELAKSGVTIEAGAPESLRGAASGGGAVLPKERENAETLDAAAAEKAEKKAKSAAPLTRRITLYFVEKTR
jgi:hypothetical protein